MTAMTSGTRMLPSLESRSNPLSIDLETSSFIAAFTRDIRFKRRAFYALRTKSYRKITDQANRTLSEAERNASISNKLNFSAPSTLIIHLQLARSYAPGSSCAGIKALLQAHHALDKSLGRYAGNEPYCSHVQRPASQGSNSCPDPPAYVPTLYGTDVPDLRNLLLLLVKESETGGQCGTLYAESL